MTSQFNIIDTKTGRTVAEFLGFDKACAKCDKLNLKANYSRYRIVDSSDECGTAVGLN